MSIITIIRHGTTQGIEQGLLQGSTDSPLSPRGLREAQLTAGALKTRSINKCYCSPLGRTRETAAIICQPLGITPIYLEDLQEYDFGSMEGQGFFKPPEEDASLFIKLKSLVTMVRVDRSGESIACFRRRVRGVWQFLLEQNLEGQNLIITHGLFINMFMQEILPELPRNKKRLFDVNACGMTDIELVDGHPQLLRLNDKSHLKELKKHDH
jgi:broad specificity phosphatase PhoE